MQFHAAAIAAILMSPAPADSAADGLARALREVEQLSEAINAGEPAREQLFDALARFHHYAPLLAADPAARAARARAQLNLARTYLSEGASASAAGIMDEVLRSAFSDPLPVDQFGPSLVALHDERRAALMQAGTASLEFNCSVPCQAYVNEQAVGRRVEGLYLGIYRIWIDAAGNDFQPGPPGVENFQPGSPGVENFHIEWVKLSEPNHTYEVAFLQFTTPVEHNYRFPPGERLLPRPVEIALLAAGAGFVSAGAVMLGLANEGERSQIGAGAALTGFGGAALLLGGITLAVDEIRVGGARGRQAMLHWQMNF